LATGSDLSRIADAERDGQDDGGGESGGLLELAEGELEIDHGFMNYGRRRAGTGSERFFNSGRKQVPPFGRMTSIARDRKSHP
jgi:hypothetical protein